MCVDRKIDAARDCGSAVDLIKAGPDVKSGDTVQRDQVYGPRQGQLDALLLCLLRGRLRQTRDLLHGYIPLFVKNR